MALQGAARHLLSFASSSSRMFGGAAVNSGLPSLLCNNDEEQKEQQASISQGPTTSPQGLRSFASSPLASSARLPFQSRLGLGPLPSSPLPRSPLLPHQPPHVRSLNSWTAAQRYFVEGDHVIAAEVGRTFQFTGLDSGSFYPFVVYTGVATVIATAFMVIPWIIAPQRVDLDKSSAYECGFDAFGEARQTFSVSFYLVSIMYLLFDIEICYLFPYVMCHANAQMFWTMNLFLSLLVVGFVYEWGVGALEWRQ